MTGISDKAEQFIVAQEDGSESYYDRTEAHFDWPGGASGPTVAVGYDLGYCTVKECMEDWGNIIPGSAIQVLLGGVGLTGDQAHMWVQEHRTDVTITWAEALQEFHERELPKWETRVKLVLPNYDLLSPDCKGAIVSLSYNRGTGGYNSNLPRNTEMVQIKAAMVAQKYELIPGLIKSMIRLWPNVTDLRQRRILEANLFAGGLSECVKTSPASSSPPPSDAPSV